MLMSKALSKASDVSILLDFLCIYCSNFSEKTCIKTGSLINAKFRQKATKIGNLRLVLSAVRKLTPKHLLPMTRC